MEQKLEQIILPSPKWILFSFRWCQEEEVGLNLQIQRWNDHRFRILFAGHYIIAESNNLHDIKALADRIYHTLKDITDIGNPKVIVDENLVNLYHRYINPTPPIGNYVAVKKSSTFKITPGTHLAVLRSGIVPYFHHAIYMGNYEVSHYTGPNKSSSRPQISTLGDFFSDSKQFCIINWDWCFDKEYTLAIALEMVGDVEAPKYSLIFHNCEHFATWCKIGVNSSQQIKQFYNPTTKMISIKGELLTDTEDGTVLNIPKDLDLFEV